jgi:inhibitor of KinA
MSASVTPLGDSALLVRFGDAIDPAVHRQVRALAAQLDQHPLIGMVEYIPAFASVAILYDPSSQSFQDMASAVNEILSALSELTEPESRVVEIPTCYGGKFGPDLDFVAEHNGLTCEEVVHLHSSAEYTTYMIGFAPGFPYLGGMPPQIAVPRRSSPRLRVPAGSVGIAGGQTGVYPLETPGGWQLIGRTPRALFRAENDPPILLRCGDLVRFRPMTRSEYEAWQEPD